MAKEDDNPTSVKEMMATMQKSSDGTNIIKEYKKTFSSPDGSDKKGDVIVDTPAEGLALLKQLVHAKKESIKKESKRKIWDFRTSPHEHFGKTLDDTFMTFVLWAKLKASDKDNAGIEGETAQPKLNVSKALRRLETYAEWMEETGEDLVDPPLSPTSIKKALDAWHMNASTDPEDGCFLWWCDMSKIDREYLKKEIPPEESLRALVWYSHYVMYSESAQKNGMKFLQNMDNIGLIASLTFIPAKLGAKLDRFTIGVLPVKMKGMYMIECPGWIKLFMNVIRIFMSKKMKQRIVILKDWDEVAGYVGGDESIPKGWGKLEGSLEDDPVDQQYFSN
eukprot:CAMPEP_0197259408 /NCGR_PEP_ID=MMETSP1429-20130617/83495_1 /TAXON_ID=49237 /ORGANISM="Chaetoceros  sp., Strain UNC1202" /LENGTH=334 /DNA_ID=CAMNT_0042723617 /DNA_START=2464 /DNA_END=3468 /DNA_ORIENTATION=-